MKKSIFTLLGLALLIAFTFSSCAKDRICECTTDGYTTETEYEGVSKTWMKNSAGCVSYTVTDEDGDTYSVDCEIK